MYRILEYDNGFVYEYEKFLFNRKEFLDQYGKPVTSFYLINTRDQKVSGEIHFVTDEGVAVSPYRASFGSFQLASRLKAEIVSFFIEEAEEKLKKENIRSVRIRSYPFSYDYPSASLLSSLLIQHGYSVTVCDTNFHITVSDHTTFYNALRQSEKSRLNAAVNKGMNVALNLNPDLTEVYDLMLKCRQDKGYPFRISLQDFQKMFALLPDFYNVFEVRYQGQLIAAAVTVKINQEILYNFHLGQLPEFRKYSPAVLLLKEIYSFAKRYKFNQLDLGIGTDSGIYNFPLVNFKQNMGGIPSLKPLFEKQIHG
jgi:hypothetical protein